MNAFQLSFSCFALSVLCSSSAFGQVRIGDEIELNGGKVRIGEAVSINNGAVRIGGGGMVGQHSTVETTTRRTVERSSRKGSVAAQGNAGRVAATSATKNSNSRSQIASSYSRTTTSTHSRNAKHNDAAAATVTRTESFTKGNSTKGTRGSTGSITVDGGSVRVGDEISVDENGVRVGDISVR